MFRCIRLSFTLLIFSCCLLKLQAEEAEKKTVAVDKFNTNAALEKLKINGWWIAEKMENELAQRGIFQVMTRARIASILKEKKVGAGSGLNPKTLGHIIGAQYIVTGQAEFSDGKLSISANLLDVKEEAGEYEESYEDSISANEGNIYARLNDLIDALAQKFSMTSGELLDYGLKMMKEGNFHEAVQAFRDVGKRNNFRKLRKMMETVPEKQLDKAASEADISGQSVGESLDYAISLHSKGDLNGAKAVLAALRKTKTVHDINNLISVAEKGRKQNEEKFRKLINDVRRKYQNAIAARDEKERKKDPASLCDEAITELRSFMSNPKMHIDERDKKEISALIEEIEAFRKKLFAGPAKSRAWTVPGLKIELIPVAPGKFKRIIKRGTEEFAREITISRPFWISKYEISAGQFQPFLKSSMNLSKRERYNQIDKYIDFDDRDSPFRLNYNLKRGVSKDTPASCISWQAAKNFCRWLTKRESQAGRLPAGYEYRLPTEAEWEYCCRAGTNTAFSFGDDTKLLDKYALYRENSYGKPSPGGKKRANPWGIYDMHGNLWEWCEDWYEEELPAVNVTDPCGPEDSRDNCKVLRGGSFASSPIDLRSSSRYSCDYKRGKRNAGFRIVCAPEL